MANRGGVVGKAIDAFRSRAGIAGFAVGFAKPIIWLINMLGDIDLVGTYLPTVNTFIESGLGTAATVLAGAFIVAYAIYRKETSDSNDAPTLKWEPSKMIGIGLVIVLAGLLIAGAGAILQRRQSVTAEFPALVRVTEKPDISWNFDSGNPVLFIGLSVTGEPITAVPGEPPPTLAQGINALDVNKGFVLGFQASGKSNLDIPITQVSGYIRSDITNQTMPINFVVDSEPVPPDQTYCIPALADFNITTVSVPIANPPVDGIPVAKFRVDFASFVFVFSYDGKTTTRHFSAQEVANQFDLFTRSIRPGQSAIPRVARKLAAQ